MDKMKLNVIKEMNDDSKHRSSPQASLMTTRMCCNSFSHDNMLHLQLFSSVCRPCMACLQKQAHRVAVHDDGADQILGPEQSSLCPN